MTEGDVKTDRHLRRFRRFSLVILHDLACAAFAYWASAAIIMPLHQFAADLDAVLPVAILAGCLSILLSAAYGVFSTRWRLASLTDFVALIKSAATLTIVLLLAREAYHTKWPEPLFVAELRILVLGGIFTLGLQAAGRILYRYHHSQRRQQELNSHQDASIFIGGLQEAESAIKSAEQGLLSANIVGCLLPDDIGATKQVRGRPVLGNSAALETAYMKMAAGGIAVTSVMLSRTFLTQHEMARGLKKTARRLGLTLLKMEAVALGGRTEIRFEDFLFRERRQIDHTAIDQSVSGKKLLVTGGGGSIGGDIALRAAAHGAKDILLLDISELGLQSRLAELRREHTACHSKGVICDVADEKRLNEIVFAFKPDILVHAAALKHVDLVEENWQAAVRTNVFGTLSALDAANKHCVPVFINISTDKAVEPVGILGLTKRMGERLVAATSSQRGVVRFSVRFGNVLGSSGSVIDTFLNQIVAGGPITLTDERVQRYFMSRTEAAELVLASCAIGETSRLFLLDMGEPILIKDLAAQLIEWSGRAPDEDIKIVTTGLRPGERLEEKLVAGDERVFPSKFSGISCIDSSDIKLCDLTHLETSVETGNLNLARKLLYGVEMADMRKPALTKIVN